MKNATSNRLTKLEEAHPAPHLVHDLSRLSYVELDVMEELIKSFGHSFTGEDGRPSKALNLADVPDGLKPTARDLLAKVELVTPQERWRRWMQDNEQDQKPTEGTGKTTRAKRAGGF